MSKLRGNWRRVFEYFPVFSALGVSAMAAAWLALPKWRARFVYAAATMFMIVILLFATEYFGAFYDQLAATIDKAQKI